MNLEWSHAVINVRDLDKMIGFYTDVLGFTVSDRGPLAPNAPEIVFMSNDPNEHHQIAMVPMRNEEGGNPVNHFAFRVAEFEEVGELHGKLTPVEGVHIHPLCHGNALSLYFNDPEGNGLEVFWDTPWHVAQPQGKVWDPGLDRDAALTWVEDNFSTESSFTRSEAAGAEFVNRTS